MRKQKVTWFEFVNCFEPMFKKIPLHLRFKAIEKFIRSNVQLMIAWDKIKKEK